MKLQTGKLYWKKVNYWEHLPAEPFTELIVIIDISEERDRISYYDISTGRLYPAFLNGFKDAFTLSPT